MFDLLIYSLGWISLIAIVFGGIGYGLLYLWAKAHGMPD